METLLKLSEIEHLVGEVFTTGHLTFKVVLLISRVQKEMLSFIYFEIPGFQRNDIL